MRRCERMKVYLSGPMTYKKNNNRKMFVAAAAWLRSSGYEVENPAEKEMPDDTAWEQWMRVDLRDMLTCDAVVMLPGWEQSRGAHLELHVAHRVGIRVEFWEHIRDV